MIALCMFVRPSYAHPGVTRLGGSDRYDTMSQIVSEGFSLSSWAVVATGDNFPDALAASGLAGAKGCPIILTSKSYLSSEARSQLSRLGVTDAYIVGGTGAVSTSVESAMRSMGISVTRVSGSDRVGTSLQIMSAARSAGSGSGSVVIATGSSFADSLSIAPWCWRTATPIVLALNGRLTSAAVAAIKSDANIREVILVGGTSSVGDIVYDQLGSGYSYLRISGSDRYATSRYVAEWEAANGLGWTDFGIATGQSFPDALAGAALLGSKASPLVLASEHGYADAAALVSEHGVDASRVFVLGGESSISSSLVCSLMGFAAPSGTTLGKYSISGRVHIHQEFFAPANQNVDVVSLVADTAFPYTYESQSYTVETAASDIMLSASNLSDYSGWASLDGMHITITCDAMQQAYHDASYYNVDTWIVDTPRLVSVG